jgi:hypothetical protein
MDDRLSAAARFINTTSGHIFLTGKAGTGKTTFLKKLPELTHKSLVVVAPTGIAALNAGGVTIHSQFLIPPATFIPDRNASDQVLEQGGYINQQTLARKHPLNSERKQVLRSIDLLVIDEVSMLRADLLDAIDYRMKAVRGNFRKPFGGVQVLFIGDLYQLPPVVRNEQWGILRRYYPTPWFYEAHALQQDPLIYIELDKIYRQHDTAFIDLLNNLRNNSTTERDLVILNDHCEPPEVIREMKEVITLTTHNYKAEEINKAELQALGGPSYFFDADIDYEFPEGMYPVQQRLELKRGAQIMFVRNDAEDKMYFNGKLATVTDIEGDEIQVTMASSHVTYQLKKVKWENKSYKVNKETRELEEEVIGSFQQYPVRLAWAITVHKSQGLTFDKAIIDVGQAFADGQVYVALSRLRSLDGLILRSPIPASVISTDKNIVAFVAQNNHPEQLPELMKVRQQEFLKRLLNDTFDFAHLVQELRHMNKQHDDEGLLDPTMKPVLLQLADVLDQEGGNTLRYRQQLSDLVTAGDQVGLLNRLEKGSAYYRKLIIDSLKQLLIHTEIVRRGKRVKTHLNQLGELDQYFSKQWEELDKSVWLSASILRGEEVFDASPLAQKRHQERLALQEEVRLELQKTGLPAPKESKAKKRKKSKDGDQRSTFEITLDLVKEGLSVAEIAQKRDMVIGTIEGHLAKAVSAGQVSILSFMTSESVDEILEAYRSLPEGASSKDLFIKLKGKYTYGALRAAVAHENLKTVS